jgi:Zn-dependent protease with chaperone function
LRDYLFAIQLEEWSWEIGSKRRSCWGVLTLLIVWIGHFLGGQQGMVIAFILAMGMNFFSYWFSDKIVLSMYLQRRFS